MILKQAIPYSYVDSGFSWNLIGVHNNFSRPIGKTLVSVEYENQYGHIQTLDAGAAMELATTKEKGDSDGSSTE